jgi:hypothetical protein
VDAHGYQMQHVVEARLGLLPDAPATTMQVQPPPGPAACAAE